MQQLADTLKNVKLTSDERDKVRELIQQGDTDKTAADIKSLLDEMTKADGKRPKQDEKKL